MLIWIKNRAVPIALILWALSLVMFPIVKFIDYKIAQDMLEPWMEKAMYNAVQYARIENRVIKNFEEIKKGGGYK